MNFDKKIKKTIFILSLLLCAVFLVDPAFALLSGFLLGRVMENPFSQFNHSAISLFLKISVIGLGFGMNLNEAFDTGRNFLLLIFFTILLVMFLGYLIGKLLKVDKRISYLISSGTAICGASAVVAVSSFIKSNKKHISASLTVIFILNFVALFTFPIIGKLLNLTNQQFGLWCALAIHDTSSVIGAATKYSQEALMVATTIKLVRILFIVPISFFTMFMFKSKKRKIGLPYFIIFFLLSMCFSNYLLNSEEVSHYIVFFAKKILIVALFLVGVSFSFESVKSVGFRPLLQGIILWVIVSILSLILVNY